MRIRDFGIGRGRTSKGRRVPVCCLPFSLRPSNGDLTTVPARRRPPDAQFALAEFVANATFVNHKYSVMDMRSGTDLAPTPLLLPVLRNYYMMHRAPSLVSSANRWQRKSRPTMMTWAFRVVSEYTTYCADFRILIFVHLFEIKHQSTITPKVRFYLLMIYDDQPSLVSLRHDTIILAKK